MHLNFMRRWSLNLSQFPAAPCDAGLGGRVQRGHNMTAVSQQPSQPSQPSQPFQLCPCCARGHPKLLSQQLPQHRQGGAVGSLKKIARFSEAEPKLPAAAPLPGLAAAPPVWCLDNPWLRRGLNWSTFRFQALEAKAKAAGKARPVPACPS